MKNIILILFVIFTTALNAADYRGKVILMEEETEVFGATVQLLDTLRNVYKGDKTNKKGEFTFSDVKYGKYTLKISYVGYKTIEYKYTLTKSSDRNFGVFKMEVAEVQTGDVVVEASAILGEMVGDTAQYNAQAVKVADDAMVDELLKKLPGIEVDANGQLKAQGKKVDEVLVDGKTFFGNNPKTVLENVPANIVDKVQVYDKNTKEDEFSGKNTEKDLKALNITLQEDKKVGTFGLINAGYGTEDLYSVDASMNYMNGTNRLTAMLWVNNNKSSLDIGNLFENFGSGSSNSAFGTIFNSIYNTDFGGSGGAPVFAISAGDGLVTKQMGGINYSNEFGKILEMSVFCMFSKSSNESERETKREYILGENANREYNQFGHGETDGENFSVDLDFIIKPDSSNRIMFTPSASIGKNEASSVSTTVNQFKDGKKINDAETDYFTNADVAKFRNYLNYTHKFEKEGRRLSVIFSQDFSENDGYALQNGIINYYEAGEKDILDRKSDAYSKDVSFSGTISASEPITEKSTINFDFDIEAGSVEDNRETNNRDADGRYSLRDSAMSSNYNSSYAEQKANLGYAFRIGEMQGEYFRMEANLIYNNKKISGEQVLPLKYKVDYSYGKFLPKILLGYGLNSGLGFSLEYKSDFSTPSISALNEVVDNNNPLQIVRGNRSLKASIDDKIEVGVDFRTPDFKHSLYIHGILNWQNDYLTRSYFTASNDTLIDGIALKNGTQLIRRLNMDGYFRKSLSALYFFPLPFKGVTGNLNMHLSQIKSPMVINENRITDKETQAGAQLGIMSSFSQDFSFSAGGGFNYSLDQNPLNSSDYSYKTYSCNFSIDWKFWHGFYVKTSIRSNFYTGMYYDDGDFDVHKLDFAIGYKFLKNDACKITLSFNDILNQEKAVTNSFDGYYSEFTRSTVMPRYAMLNVSWKFNTLGAKKSNGLPEGTVIHIGG